MILKCLIVDDEPIARQILEKYIGELPNLELSGSCKNAIEAMNFLQINEVDILFLDINMPKLSGLNLIRSLKNTPNVIITTAYSEYALEGFELAVVDYLLKPFSFERFLQAIMKVQVKNKSEPTKDIVQTENEFTFVKSDKKFIKLFFSEINYIEAHGNYIKIYTEKMLLIPDTLSSFLDKLPVSFIRIHKSFIINFDKLKLIEGNQVMLINKAKLPIGKSYKKDLTDKIRD